LPFINQTPKCFITKFRENVDRSGDKIQLLDINRIHTTGHVHKDIN